MIRQCAIMIGGPGTRAGAHTAETPGPILPLGGRPFLAWVLRELARFGIDDVVLLTGFCTDRIRDALPTLTANLPKKMHIAISDGPCSAGTGGAIWHARDLLRDRFMVCSGESLFATNLAPLVAWRNPCGRLGHLMLRHVPDAAGFGTVDRIGAGLYAFDRAIIDHLSADCSLERDALAPLAADGRLSVARGEGYFIDIGLPEDRARARTELPDRLRRPALFLDRDGVINIDRGWVGTRERFAWVDGALDAIRDATNRGWHVFIVTNQSGIARGLYTEEQARDLLRWIADEARAAGGTIDDTRYCPHHADAALPEFRRACGWRKPEPGMLLDLIEKWDIDPRRALMIGDQPTDIQAGHAAGIASYLFPGGNLAAFVASLQSPL